MENGDYIKREDAILMVQRYGVGCFDPDDFSPEQAGRFVINHLNEITSAPVRPVVRGKWEETDNPDVCCCTVCNTPFYRPDAYIYYFCPNCGADMRQGEEQAE